MSRYIFLISSNHLTIPNCEAWRAGSHDMPVEKKTLYADFAALGDICGLQLDYDPHKKGYRLLNPPFEPYELRLLVDSVQSSKFITREKTSMGCVMSKCFEMLCKWSL